MPLRSIFKSPCSNAGAFYFWGMKYTLHFTIAISLLLTALSGCKKDTDGTTIKICELGYEAADCKTESRTKFIGDYLVTKECDTLAFPMQITTVSSDVTAVNLENAFGDNLTRKAYLVSTNTLRTAYNNSLPSIRWQNDTLTYTADCDYTAVKQ